tara:strand:- start:483 stop:884 length:402 start_codon:yes stop_codon:yes gene_type:complete
MTRINLVNPKELTDQHLVAEYREIFMVGSSLQRSMKSKSWNKTINNIPKEFTLNKGHVTFFYNKGKYLDLRYTKLVNEMKRRGMKPDPKRKFKKSQWPKYLYNDWKPNAKDLQIIRKRINEKINLKPDWYRYS